jgi:hypothetical protein
MVCQFGSVLVFCTNVEDNVVTPLFYPDALVEEVLYYEISDSKIIATENQSSSGCLLLEKRVECVAETVEIIILLCLNIVFNYCYIIYSI